MSDEPTEEPYKIDSENIMKDVIQPTEEPYKIDSENIMKDVIQPTEKPCITEIKYDKYIISKPKPKIIKAKITGIR